MKRLIATLYATSALTVASLCAVVGATAAHAQDAAKHAEDADASKDIIVTGTLIRGKAPVGSNAISLGQAKVDEVGTSSANQLLGSIPQVSNYFNKVAIADLGITVEQVQVARPNIRGLTGLSAASSGTLVLVDGHRIAPSGVKQASPDPDMIPVGAIERVEVVTEGGSATYGADAVAGTINFITRKRFDGVKVDAHYGFADSYSQWDGSITAGKTFDTGSVYVAYSYSQSDALFGRDRDYIGKLNFTKLNAAGGYNGRDTECSASNLATFTTIDAQSNPKTRFNANTFAAPGFVAGTVNACDNSKNRTYIPSSKRHGVLVGLNFDLGANTTIDVRAYYGRRKTHGSADFTGSIALGPLNPASALLPAGLVTGPTSLFGFAATSFANIDFNLRPLLGDSAVRTDTTLENWGASAELEHNLNSNWQVRALLNWNHSDSSYDLTKINASRLAAAGLGSTAATAFNPLDVTKNNAGLVADIIDNEIAGRAKDTLLNFRTIVEGKLFGLPGGDARLAVGYEYMHDKVEKVVRDNIRIGTLGSFTPDTYSRNVHSLFAELQLPLVSDGNGGSMVTVSASGRYDHYSDFGKTINPKFGLTFKPVKGLTLRGNWGTSFAAPAMIDQIAGANNILGVPSGVPTPFTKPGDLPTAGTAYYSFSINGSVSPLLPQKAHTWSVGADLEPTRGLRLSASYFGVDFKDILGPPTPNSGIYTDNPNNIIASSVGLTPAQVISFFNTRGGGIDYTAQINTLIAANTGKTIYSAIDFRTGNFGVLKVRGLDFAVNYQLETGFGSVDLGWNGVLQLSRKLQSSPTAVVTDRLNPLSGATYDADSKLSMQTQIGANIGAFRAQATWNHTAGYPVPATVSIPVQTRVGSFDTINMFFKYDVPGSSKLLKDLSITLNVNNVFDKNPPILLRSDGFAEYGFANGSTLGRMIQFGISKKF